MGKAVAFFCTLVAWITFSAQAVHAYDIISGIHADVFHLKNWQHSSGSDAASIPLPYHGILENLSAYAGLPPMDGPEAHQGPERGWSDPLLSSVAAGLFTGSLMASGGTTYYIDPHTLCVTATGSGYGTCEICAAENTGFSGGFAQRHGGFSSAFSQSGLMVVAGIALIGLSSLGKNRESRSRVRVYSMQSHFQPWKTRTWKDQPAPKRPAYQVKVA